ncbi:L,D-transpeptidase family protein [Sulfurovum sp. bin170]|uniref:L,D-transpeptidase family protein n=1 Tax=Sulfurovum sp. bin170 TaxID=2695268 RepID=UPI0013DFBBD3|nr:L,D-transpeptidase family protein [Sulfurovum sp. bin170]NEW60074.1 L,D-transpeptidase family protein [Sulfurovum sp. bin170]
MFRSIVILAILSMTLMAESFMMAEKVIVKKSTRMLYLSAGGEIYKKYHISLGIMPIGAKEIEGDMKTPEGRYVLDYRQASRLYNRSIHLSYPNNKDKAKAKELNASAGGMIMIHGTPSNWSLSPIGDWMSMLLDWTEGCIALSNDDMEEVWDRTTRGTPIIIIP